tara:strand:- start:684 stop:1907 length:1224 start_codon:yes stop_codon:yes gene_type:complete
MGDAIIFGNKWDFECKIGETSFTKDAIRSMNLVENIFNPFWAGEIGIKDTYNMVDNLYSSKGDGSDIFTIKMKPKDGGGDPLELKGILWDETNDVSFQDRADMFKIYRIVDDGFVKLNIPIPYGKRYRGKVGKILKDIYQEYGLPIGAAWDEGDHEIDIFPEHILPPISFRMTDLVQYLVRINYKKVGQDTHVRTLLYWDRGVKAYVLKGLDTMFSNTKCEEGFLGAEFGVGIAGGDCPSTLKSFLHSTNLMTPMLTVSNEYFMNSMVSGYDPELGEHGIREVRISDVKAKWGKEIVKKMGAVTPFLPLSQDQKTKLFRTMSFPFKLDNMAKLAEAELIGNMTFYNLELALQQLGDTKRHAGMFASVSVNSVFENKKLVGNWLVTKVGHQFINDVYYNVINMCKVYT